jgi:hypothetical protein
LSPTSPHFSLRLWLYFLKLALYVLNDGEPRLCRRRPLLLRHLRNLHHSGLVDGYFRLPHFYSLVIVLIGRRTERTVVRRAHIRRGHPRRMVREAASRASAPTATKASTAALPPSSKGLLRLRPPHCWCHRFVARVPFPLQSKEQKPPSQSAVSSAPLFGGSAAGDARQARISSYTKTIQQRENGPSVPWVLTKFRRDSARTRQSLFWCIGCRALTLKKFDSAPCKLLEEFLPHPWESQSALSAGRRLRRTGAATP